MFSPDRFASERRNTISSSTFRNTVSSASNPSFRSNPNAFATPNLETSRPLISLRSGFRTGTSFGKGGKFPGISGGAGGRKTLSEPATPGSVLKDRGLRPSDLSDPHKKEFLTNLTNRVFHLALEEGSDREKIPLERLFTPATDSGDITPRKKKAFASSDFYAPNHPTIDDQLQLAQNISKSLIDQNNKTSRGQAMYEKRKQRSVKWIHQEGGKLVQQEVEEEEEAQGSEFLEMNDVQPKISKPAMKLVMNPKGVQDHTTVEQHYQQLLEQSNMSSSNMSPGVPASPEMVRDIITDMQSPTGKGAALFAKRKKRMDKFIVDETNVQKSSAYQQEQQSFVQNTTTEKSTVNQFSSFSSSTSSSSSSSSTNQQKPGVLGSSIPVSNKKKSLQARDEEQQRIMAEFLKNRESQFQIVKTPWEAVLETGNTSAAFKQNVQTKSSFSSTISAVSGPALPGGAAAPPPWLEMPQPVPVTAPLPKSTPSAPLPTPPSPFAAYTAGPAANEGVGGTGLVYTAEVKVVQPSGQPKSQVFQPSAAPSPFTPLAPVAKPAAPAASLSQPIFTAPAAAKPAPVFTKPVPSPGGLGGPLAQGAGFVSQAEAEERRKSMNFNLAANGWGNYNKYYRPISFAS